MCKQPVFFTLRIWLYLITSSSFLFFFTNARILFHFYNSPLILTISLQMSSNSVILKKYTNIKTIIDFFLAAQASSRPSSANSLSNLGMILFPVAFTLSIKTTVPSKYCPSLFQTGVEFLPWFALVSYNVLRSYA